MSSNEIILAILSFLICLFVTQGITGYPMSDSALCLIYLGIYLYALYSFVELFPPQKKGLIFFVCGVGLAVLFYYGYAYHHSLLLPDEIILRTLLFGIAGYGTFACGKALYGGFSAQQEPNAHEKTTKSSSPVLEKVQSVLGLLASLYIFGFLALS